MNNEFLYKEFDAEGEKTLLTIASANKFNRWMYQTIKPFCQGEILEIGSGIGNISQFFVKDNFDISLSDIRTQYCDKLRLNFPKQKVERLDLVHNGFDSKYRSLLESYDTIFALNVIEHIEDDKLAIVNLKRLLKPGGTCIILVPAFNFLYNTFDKDLFHYRRYNRDRIKSLLSPHFEISYTRYFKMWRQ